MINNYVVRLIPDPLRELAFPMDGIANCLVFLPCSPCGPHLGQITEKISVIDECCVHDYKRLTTSEKGQKPMIECKWWQLV